MGWQEQMKQTSGWIWRPTARGQPPPVSPPRALAQATLDPKPTPHRHSKPVKTTTGKDSEWSAPQTAQGWLPQGCANRDSEASKARGGCARQVGYQRTGQRVSPARLHRPHASKPLWCPGGGAPGRASGGHRGPGQVSMGSPPSP